MRKNVWWLTWGNAGTWSGGVKYEREIRNRLEHLGWDVNVFSLPPEAEGSIVKRHFFSNFRIVRNLFPRISKGGIVVEPASFHSRLFLFNLLAGFLYSGRFVTIVHHMDYHGMRGGSLFKAIDRLLEALFFRTVHQVIVVSEATKREVAEVGVPQNRISIVPDAFNCPPKIDFKRDDDQLQVLFVGTCYPRKGLDYLLGAMRQLVDRNIVLNLVGNLEVDIEYTRHIQSVVGKYGLKGKVIFHGLISEEELWRQYAHSDVFVLPSLWEGFGIVLLEAMSFGLPIVATNVSAIPELIKDEWNGLLVPPGDSEALAKAIARLDDNPELRDKLKRNGLARSKGFLSWEEVSKQFSQVLKGLL